MIAPILAITLLSLCATPLARAQAASGVEAKLKSMEDSWAAAQLQKDHGASVVDGLLAADFFGVDPKGKIRNKAETLERMRSDTDTYTYTKNDSMDVHLNPMAMHCRRRRPDPSQAINARRGIAPFP